MSFMDRTKQHLEDGSEKGSPKSRVIDGRLYVSSDSDDIYRAVPRGMDDAKNLKINLVPDYVVRGDKEYPIVDGSIYMQDLRKNGAEIFSADKADRFAALEAVDYTPQDFIQVDKPVAIMCQSDDGRSVPQLLEPGDYLTMASEDHIYGVPAEEFNSTYIILKDREIPEIDDISDDSLELDDMQL